MSTVAIRPRRIKPAIVAPAPARPVKLPPTVEWSGGLPRTLHFRVDHDWVVWERDIDTEDTFVEGRRLGPIGSRIDADVADGLEHEIEALRDIWDEREKAREEQAQIMAEWNRDYYAGRGAR